MGELAATFEKSQAEVLKLHGTLAENILATARNQKKSRMAQLNIERVRLESALKVAKAEAKSAKSREQGTESVRKKGTTTLIDLGEALDRFAETGVFGIEDLVETAGEGFAESTSVASDAAAEVAALEEDVKIARLEGIAAVAEAEAAAAEQRYQAYQATLAQAHTVNLLAAAQERLNQQAASFYGMTSQGADRASQGWGGIAQTGGGLLKIVGGVAMGVLSGGTLAVPAIMSAVSGVKDLAEGIPKIAAYKDDIKESWEAADGWGKAALVGGSLASGLGGAASIGYGAYTGDWAGASQLVGASGELGQHLSQAPFNMAKARNARAESVYQERVAAEERAYQAQRMRADLEWQRQKSGFDANADYAKASVAIEQLTKEVKTASTKDEAKAANELLQAAKQQRDQMLQFTKQQQESLKGLTDQVKSDADSARKNAEALRNKPLPNLDIHVTGDAITTRQLNEIVEQVNKITQETGAVRMRVEQLENPRPGASQYVGVRQ
ncbi:hypothetical protein CAQU_04950 [Corynebacterium aquilae DSM 44791]|uniref:Uncharacterized protein n=2 Tax=Corynebacterium aquilae TaxID=203263 RepID=A0A1L7CFF5_9CORY|nr:hypothetical protein CAQU_04950 [Corynebacterium aquilae DSM 44791]